MSARIWFALSLILPSLFGAPELGQFVLKTYSPRTYLASPQNWAILEDPRGILYFGNTDGVLEFDGVSWRRITLPNAKAVRSLALDSSGRVFVGGQNEVGYLSPDPATGATRFISLLDRFPLADRTFGDVWSIVTSPEGVYFSTTERLFLYNPQSGIRAWKAAGRFRRAFRLNGILHIQVSGVGLHTLQNEQLSLAPGGATFDKQDVRGTLNLPTGPVVVASKGFFRPTANGFTELVLPATRPIIDQSIYSVATLAPQLHALGTARGGLLLMDGEGRILRTLDKPGGLPSDYIGGMGRDRQGGVWLATGNGLVRFSPQISFFNEADGLRGTLLSLTRWREDLYVGTTSGLFRLGPTGFSPVAEFTDSTWSLLPRPDALYVGTQNGLYTYDGRRRTPQLKATEVVYEIAASTIQPDTLYLATRTAAVILTRRGGEWQTQREIPSQGEEFRTIANDAEGTLWATTRASIVRINPTTGQARVFSTADGLPAGWQNVFRVGARLLFATEKGLRKLDPASQRWLPDDSLGPQFAYGDLGVLLIREGPTGHLWLSGANYHGRWRNGQWQPMPLLPAGFDDLWAVHEDPSGVTWAASSDGRLGRWDPTLAPAQLPSFSVHIRRLLQSQTRSPLFEGPSANPILITPQLNQLRLEFSAPFFDDPARVEYQTAVDQPLNADSAWSTEAWRDFSNLWEGAHTLRVRARNPYGQLSPETTLQLDVQPPWYRAWWAYVLYVALLAILLRGVFHWRLRQLRENNQRLERLVEERTAEIVAQEKQTEALLLNILPASVATELKTSGAVTPMFFPDVTVCFTDFVGFTVSSESVAAADLVAQLHAYFTAFDEITARYGLEKLKTIGDSYMFVSGLPQADPLHAVKAVQAAGEILAASRALGANDPRFNWQIRIGLHSGPVVAGVVGRKKFAFDIWGDTVNLASRMESSSAPNRINVSEATYSKVRDAIPCEPRGPVRTKDGRDLPMYFANPS